MGVAAAASAPADEQPVQVLLGVPGAEPEHGFMAVRTERAARWSRTEGAGLRGLRRGRRCLLRVGRGLPGVLFLWGEEGFLVEQGAHAIEAEFGGGMEPAEGTDACEVRRQDVLEETAQPLVGLEGDGGVLAGLAVAIGPQEAAVGQLGEETIVGGGFEDVAGEVTEGILTGAGGLGADVPGSVPDIAGHLGQEVGMVLLQASFEEGATAIGQGAVVEQEVVFGGKPLAAVGTQAAAGHQVVNVGMEDEGAAPGVEHAQHAQLGAQAPGVGGQLLQGLGAGGKEQVQRNLEMGADEHPQRFGQGEGDQEVRGGQKESLLLALEPGVGVGLAAERTVPVVAGVITVVKAVAVGAGQEFSAPGRGAAGQDRVQHLSLPRRHGGAEAPEIIRRQAPEPLMDGKALATVAGGRMAHRSPMKSSRRF
jgi:hypothetical protein